MSSKNVQGQGRRTPLSLNPHAKPFSQSQGRAQQQAETRSMQQKQQQQNQQAPQQQKQNLTYAAAVASAAGPVPAEKNSPMQQPNANLKNGLNNGSETTKPTASTNTNGNKAAAEEPKKEIETRNRAAKPVAEEQQQVKNGADSGAKAAFNNNSGNTVQRKQQPQQVQQPQQAQQQKQQNLQNQQAQQQQQAAKVAAEKVEDVQNKAQAESAQNKVQAAPAVVVETPKVQDKTPTKKTVQETSKNEEKQQEQQKPPTTVVTPTKTTETATKPGTPKSAGKRATSAKKYTETTTIDIEEMDTSPQKPERKAAVVAPLNEKPNATSTPGKLSKIAPIHPSTPLDPVVRVSAISGRRSIRPLTDWTPSKFENDPKFRGSYRRIKTDLDISDANSSMNVTVGSEPGNNTSWFSFRSRKRERTPPNVEILNDEVLSPPKRARFGGLFSIMASPFTALRSRFSRASIKATAEENEQNVSMGEEVSIFVIEEDEESPASEKANDSPVKPEEHIKEDKPIDVDSNEKESSSEDADDIGEQDENELDASSEKSGKERCNVM